jgi:hypothetical protein
MLTRLLPPLPVWRRALRRRRRTLALLLAAAAAVLVLPGLVPVPAQGTEVVVASRALPAGTVLAPEHLRTVEIATALVPDGTASSPAALEGERLAGPVAEGAPLLPGALVGADGPALAEGTALMVVPVPEVLLPHLAAGTRIELLLSDPVDGSSARVTAEVRSLSTATAAPGALGAGAVPGAQAIVLVDRQRSGELAHALGTSAVTVSVIG